MRRPFTLEPASGFGFFAEAAAAAALVIAGELSASRSGLNLPSTIDCSWRHKGDAHVSAEAASTEASAFHTDRICGRSWPGTHLREGPWGEPAVCFGALVRHRRQRELGHNGVILQVTQLQEEQWAVTTMFMMASYHGVSVILLQLPE